jgi:hypothetical protein
MDIENIAKMAKEKTLIEGCVQPRMLREYCPDDVYTILYQNTKGG